MHSPFAETEKERTLPRTRGLTTLILLQDSRELRLSSSLWLASFQSFRSDLLLAVCSGIWVESEKNLSVVERVLLLDTSALGACFALGGADDLLDFGGVDQTADICLLDDWGWEEEVLLQRRWGGGGAVDGVERLEGGGGPDDEASEVSTWCELQEVESEHGAGLNTGDVAESKVELLSVDFWVVDDERSTTLTVTASTELTLTSAELPGGLDLVNICGSTN